MILNSKNQGYGICGSKNVYSTSTIRVGNWVEDGAGVRLANMDRSTPPTYETEYSAKLCPIENRPSVPEAPVKTLSLQELKAKNKDGLQYGLIFGHGKDEIPVEDRFQTMTKQVSQTALVSSYALPDRYLEREKAKRVKQDISLSYNKTTEARYANGYIHSSNVNTIPHVAVGRSEDLPYWGRKSMLVPHRPN